MVSQMAGIATTTIHAPLANLLNSTITKTTPVKHAPTELITRVRFICRRAFGSSVNFGLAITVWKNAGYYMLFFLAGLQAVPEDVMEAAHLDGAGPYMRLRHIILPELKPTFLFVIVIATLNAVTQVDHVFVMTQGGPSNSTNLVLFYIYQQAVEHYDIGKASAATLLTLAALMGLTALSFRTMANREGGP